VSRAQSTWKTQLIDLLALPLTAVAAWWMRRLRSAGLFRLPRTMRLLRRIGVFPIRDHFYEPLFDPRHLRHDLDDARDLPGIDWNVDGQLETIGQLDYAEELREFPMQETPGAPFHYANGAFGPGDAEVLYGMLRHLRPSRLLEIGSGYSTRVAQAALARNLVDDSAAATHHVCVDPYAADGIEETGAEVLRVRVEELDLDRFRALEAGDILFIDSSHVLRPQGDVLFEFLRVLPVLAPGVVVHVHDIHSPADYPRAWVIDEVRLWGEQYLLEAFLSMNDGYRVLAALAFLQRSHPEALHRACPILADHPQDRPGSFWMVRQG
jgi:predicted O-methyltransferase YrrM